MRSLVSSSSPPRRKDAEKRAAIEKEIKAEAIGNEEDSEKKKSIKTKKATRIPKLDKIAILKMKPTQLKEALELCGIDR